MPRHIRIGAAMAAVLALGLSACGGDDPQATPSSPSVTVSAGTFSPDPISQDDGPVLTSKGLGIASFGDDMETAIAALVAAFGEADEDSGWVNAFSPWGTCPGNEVRMLRWDRLRVLFNNGDTDAGTAGDPHFFTYQYSALEENPAMDLATDRGIELGSTVAELKAAYEAAVEVFDEEPVGPGFTIAGPDETVIWGSLTSTADDGIVHYMEAGAPTCGE